MTTQRLQDETFEDLKELVDEEVRVDVERLSFDQIVGAAIDVVVAHREEAQKYEAIAQRKQQKLRDKEQRIEELEADDGPGDFLGGGSGHGNIGADEPDTVSFETGKKFGMNNDRPGRGR